MAVSFPPASVPLGVIIDGKPLLDRDSVPSVSDFEITLARNLRQASQCGREWVRKLLDEPDPAFEAQLAAFIAESGGRGIRLNQVGLLVQLQAASDRAERYRRAVEAIAANPHLTSATYPHELRSILTEALGRPY